MTRQEVEGEDSKELGLDGGNTMKKREVFMH